MGKALTMGKAFAAIILVAVMGFLAHYLVVGKAVYGDGRVHYGYSRSIVFDHDLKLENEVPDPEILQSMGPALIWVPIVAGVKLVSKLTGPTQGYEAQYQLTVGIGSIVMFMGAMWLFARELAREYGQKLATGAIAAMWLSSNLFFYTSLDVINTHWLSFSLAAIAMVLARAEKTYGWEGVAWGGMLGLAAVNREQDLLFLLPLALWRLLKTKRIGQLVIAGGVAGLVFWPQALSWRELTGQILSPRLVKEGYWNLAAPHLWQVLVMSRKSLLLTAPLIIVGWIGLWLTGKKPARLLLGLSLVQVYLIGCWWAWHQGESYGMRMLIVTYPAAIWGVAEAGRRLKTWGKARIAVAGILVALNMGQIWHFLSTETGGGGQGLEPATAARIRLILEGAGMEELSEKLVPDE